MPPMDKMTKMDDVNEAISAETAPSDQPTGSTRRQFLAQVVAVAPAVMATSAILTPLMATTARAAETTTTAAESWGKRTPSGVTIYDIVAAKAPFALPALTYAESALEPHIDATTMGIHHGKHHKAYVDNLNKAIDATPELKGKSLEELLSDLPAVPEKVRSAVRNNGGGHLNHTFFWQTLCAPLVGATREPALELAAAINKTFGSFADFQKAFEAAGLARFGSGWVWLVAKKSGGSVTLSVVSSPNQDNPVMEKDGGVAILGNDVWEHAYYLKYQNRRADYLKAWWNVVDWNVVGARLAAV